MPIARDRTLEKRRTYAAIMCCVGHPARSDGQDSKVRARFSAEKAGHNAV